MVGGNPAPCIFQPDAKGEKFARIRDPLCPLHCRLARSISSRAERLRRRARPGSLGAAIQLANLQAQPYDHQQDRHQRDEQPAPPVLQVGQSLVAGRLRPRPALFIPSFTTCIDGGRVERVDLGPRLGQLRARLGERELLVADFHAGVPRARDEVRVRGQRAFRLSMLARILPAAMKPASSASS